MLFLTAFLTGLFGSFHCVGMCGPIAFALPGKQMEGPAFYVGRFLYNAGRITTYALLGFVLGGLGLGLKIAGLQQSISILAGTAIILVVALNRTRLKAFTFNPLKLFSSKKVQQLFNSNASSSLFFIGILNGLLPCGFVYIALLGASATQGLWEGALFMVFFGLGTFPLMFGVSILGQFLSSNTRNRVNKLSPFFAILIGLLFIVRGLNLGIPYLSPKINNNASEVNACE